MLNNPPVTKPIELDNPELDPAISGRSLTAFVNDIETIKPCAKNISARGIKILITLVPRKLTKR